MIFIEAWLLRVGFPSSLNLHTSINSDTGKIKPPFWKGPDSLKRKDVHLGVDLSFSEKLHLQQADVLYLLAVAFFTLCDISSKHDVKEKMGSRSVVEKYKKFVFPCPRKIPWVFSFLMCDWFAKYQNTVYQKNRESFTLHAWIHCILWILRYFYNFFFLRLR